MDSSHPRGPALVAAAADADPVTLLVLGWLAAKRSANTRTAYARDIGITPRRRPSRAPSWLAWCQGQGVHPVTGVTGLHVAQYARQLDATGLSPASAARKLAAVSSWYAWLARRGHITASPADGIARPRVGPRSPPVPALTLSQSLALVHAADQAPGQQRTRTAALVALLLFTGARLNEVIGADVADLGTHQGSRVLWVTRSGRRQGLALPGPAASRIDACLAGRAGLTGVSALFATATGRRLFAADVRRAVRRLATRAGLPADLTSHLGPRAIRYSSATLYLEADGSLRDLHSALAHAAEADRDQACEQAEQYWQADQRAAAAEARTGDARAEIARVRENAVRELDQQRAGAERERDEILARLTDTASRLAEGTRTHAAELEQLRADAAREREELRGALESRARVLEESRTELRVRAERAERDLDAARAELARVRPETGSTDAPSVGSGAPARLPKAHNVRTADPSGR
jgi:integrase/recombinase XerD